MMMMMMMMMMLMLLLLPYDLQASRLALSALVHHGLQVVAVAVHVDQAVTTLADAVL